MTVYSAWDTLEGLSLISAIPLGIPGHTILRWEDKLNACRSLSRSLGPCQNLGHDRNHDQDRNHGHVQNPGRNRNPNIRAPLPALDHRQSGKDCKSLVPILS